MYRHTHLAAQKGFNLVELAIVLVVLGLLTGGVLVGKSLIGASELRSLTREREQYQAMTVTFRDKYFQIPGDLANATSYWGAAGGNGTGRDPACATALTPGVSGTCNGAGNGLVDNQGGVMSEIPLFWNHLLKAGFIQTVKSDYLGTNNTYFYTVQPRVQSGNWATCYTDRGNYGRGFANMLMLARVDPSTSIYCFMRFGAGVKGDEAWALDAKTDDGMPGTGKMTAEDGWLSYTGCTTAGSAATNTSAIYNLTTPSKNCRLFWPLMP